jgi:iron complex outermembrane receptor protein
MSAIQFSRLRGSVACLALLASGALLASPVVAQQLVDPLSSSAAGGIETVVVTGTAFDPESAPAKARLETTEPQTIINKSYIEDSVAETADYTTILAIAPGMTGFDVNGPGLSDGGVKNTMRGLPDGSYGITYDGIPFGDTNGPSHHSQSYFPGSTIGSIDIDRGPGNAGNMGASTYGGSINMFSDVLTSNRNAKVSATAGSWGLNQFVANYQTGDFDLFGTNNRVMVNLQDVNSSGYLSLQSSAAKNITIKTRTELAPGWALTLFSSYNALFQNLNDNAGITPSQVAAFGKTYALQNTNPAAGNYKAYNHVHKKTDMDYARLQGDLGNGFSIDNTLYTYDYRNKTLSTTSVQQTAANITAGITQGNGTIVGGTFFPNDVPGYTKQNAFRVYGNIFRGAKDFDFGWLTGQVRAGVWWESQSTQRARSDYDATKCFGSSNCNPWHDQTFADSRLYNSTAKPGTVVATPTSAPYGGGFFEYQEHSNWNQYQPFIELELHPIPDLTLTPGFKYVEWSRSVAAPLEQKTKPVVPVYAGYTTTRDLPFFTANYKIQPSWSVYGQYAQGIYVPDISSFEQAKPTTTFPKAQTTTNYQLGTVFYADQFTFDADVYYIAVENNITYQLCSVAPFTGSPGETCALNTGPATYRGVEGEGTYAFDGDLEGLSVFLNGSLGSGKTRDATNLLSVWIKQVPMWTSAQGIFYKRGAWKFSLIDKIVGQQYSDAANTNFYKLGAYSNMDFKGSVTEGPLEFAVSISNVLNSRSIGAVSINDKTTTAGNGAVTATSANDIFNRPNSLDQYAFQPSRGFQLTVKARF